MTAANGASYPVRTSFWGQASADQDTALAGHEEADLIVIGAGLAGLSTAYFVLAARPDLRVTVLEAQYAGYGASGRNFCNVPQLARSDLDMLLRTLGPDGARFVTEHQAQMFGEFADLLLAEGIDCEFCQPNVLLAALTEDRLAGLRRLRALHSEYGFPSELLDREQAAQYLAMPVPGALSCGRNGYVQPFKLVRGLRAAVLRRGAVLHEGSPVTRLSRRGAAVVARTAAGEVTGRDCVIATNAFSPGLGVAVGVLQPTYTYVLATTPLDDGAFSRLGWHGRHRVSLDAGVIGSYYYMQMRPNRQFLIGGGGRPAFHPDGRTIPAHDSPADFGRIEAEMSRRFGWLRGTEIECAWGGPVAMTPSGFPVTTEVAPNIYLNGGYNARGALMATLSGKALVGQIYGAEHTPPGYARYTDLLLGRDAGAVSVTMDEVAGPAGMGRP
jgi:gamma-glutamylputrescine oxidase